MLRLYLDRHQDHGQGEGSVGRSLRIHTSHLLSLPDVGFSAAAALHKARTSGAAVGQAAPAAEEELVPAIRQDTVASRVQDLYDKIRSDPDSSKSRDLAVRVENNSMAAVELSDNSVTTGGAKQDEIENRLKNLDQRFTKVFIQCFLLQSIN